MTRKIPREKPRKYVKEIESLPIGYHTLDENGKIIQSNKNFTETLGYTKKEIIGKNFFSLIPAKHKKNIKKTFESLKKDKTAKTSQFQIIKKNEKLIWVNHECNIKFDKKEKKHYIDCVLVDITRQFDTQTTWIHSELRYYSLFDSLSDAVLLLENGNIIDCNKMALEMLDCQNREQVCLKKLWDYAPKKQKNGEDSKKCFQKKHDLALNGSPQDFDFLMLKENKNEFLTEISLKKIEFQQDKLIQAIIKNVTSQRKILQNLRENEKNYKNIVESIPIPVAIHSGEKILFANPKAIEVMGGKSKEEFVKHSLWDFVHPESKKMVGERLKKLYDQREKVEILDEKFIKIGGEEIDVQVSANPVIFQGQKAVQVTFQDVTERKQVEEMRKKLLRDLSHQLKTPLNIIELTSSILEKKIKDHEQNVDSSMVHMINRNTKEMRELITKILKLSSLESGEIHPIKKRFQINKLIMETIKNLKPLADNKNLRINFIQKEKIFVNTDKEKTTDIIQNLIENSIKYTEKGSIKVSVLKKKDFCEIHVKDTGKGLNLKQKKQIFTRFYKVDPSVAGAGIGLNIVLETAKLLGGDIWVESKGPGNGSIFKVLLPLK